MPTYGRNLELRYVIQIYW